MIARARQGRDVEPPLRARGDLLQHPAVRVLDPHADVRRDHAAAVRDRAVGDRHLQRVGLQVTLADGEVDVVARCPGPVGQLLAEEAVSPGRRGHEAADLTGKVDPGRVAEAEAARPLLDDVAAALVRHQPESVEEDVRGHLQRAGQGQRPVRRASCVLERDPPDVERATVEEHRLRRDQPALERRGGGDQLERGARRVEALGRAVGQRRAVVRILKSLVHRAGHALGEDVRVEARVGAEPEHLAAARVHRHEAAGLAEALERRLAGLLHVEVDRQAQLLAGRWVANRELSLRAPHARRPGCARRRSGRADTGRTGTRCRTARRGRPAGRRCSATPSAAARLTSPSVPNRCAPTVSCGYFRRKIRSTSTPGKRVWFSCR